MIKFFLPIIPPTVTHQQKKIGVTHGKPYTYEPAKLKDTRQKLMSHLAKYAPEQPFKGAVRLLVKWCFPVTGEHQNGEYKTTKPDTDNLQKLLKDVMTDLKYWKDDALVASEIIEKFWADVPGIYIEVYEI